MAELWGQRPSQILHQNLTDFHIDMARGVAAINAKTKTANALPSDVWGDIVGAVMKGTRLGR